MQANQQDIDRGPASPDPAEQRARVVRMLRERGVSPTSQRVSIGQEILLEPMHVSAEDITRRVRLRDQNVSRATVYNTLRCFVDNGLLRQVFVGADRVYYDSNTDPHHHIFDPESSELTDVDGSRVQIAGLPELPEDRELESVELVIRVKRKQAARD